MKKFIILFWLSALTVVSCTKNEINEITAPVMLKVQAVDKDNSMIESQVIFIR